MTFTSLAAKKQTLFKAISLIPVLYYFVFLNASQLYAKISLPHIFGDNMVLQCSANVPIWGTGAPGEEVTVELNGQTQTTVADSSGKWRLDLPPQEAGGPFELNVSGTNKLVYKDVYFGEVWICAGQSNMSFPLKRAKDAKSTIESARFSRIRFLTVPAQSSEEPMADFDSQWQICSPENVGELSAVAYFFGRNMHESLKKPVGLIVLAWGGSTCEAWIDRSTLAKFPELKPLTEPDRLAQTIESQKAGFLHDGMLRPICPFAIKGVIWYQGESNASRAWQYRTLFPLLIANWRENWEQGDFPFYYVQLPNFMKTKDKPGASAWAELREAQHKTLSIRNVGEIVAIDLGEANNLHPKDKEPIGDRLARLALAKTYRKELPYSGPQFESMKIVDNKAVLTFTHTDKGLCASSKSDGPAPELTGFAIAGKDQKFYWAHASIENDQVVVSAPEVPAPVAVRYAWADNPNCNLANGVGLPASPFRTDDWVGVTVDAF